MNAQQKRQMRHMVYSFNGRSKRDALLTIRRVAGGKIRIIIGGSVRGAVKYFKTPAAAKAAVTRHYTVKLEQQLSQYR